MPFKGFGKFGVWKECGECVWQALYVSLSPQHLVTAFACRGLGKEHAVVLCVLTLSTMSMSYTCLFLCFTGLFKTPCLVPFLSRTQVGIFSPLGIFVFSPFPLPQRMLLSQTIQSLYQVHPDPFAAGNTLVSPPSDGAIHQPVALHSPYLPLSICLIPPHPPLFSSAAITPQPLRTPTPPTCVSSFPLASTLVELTALSWLVVTEGDADPDVFSHRKRWLSSQPPVPA